MSARPWFPFYARDYRDKTSDLTFLQDCAYRRLLDHYYITGKPLPANALLLHRICRAVDGAEKAAIKFVLARYFTLDGEVYRQERTDNELKKQADISKKRAEAANVRHAKAGANADALADTTTSTPTTTESGKKKVVEKFMNGSGRNGLGHRAVTITNPEERIARFQAHLARKLGSDGWKIVVAATDDQSPEFQRSLALCQQAARDLNKGWPHNWPTKPQ